MSMRSALWIYKISKLEEWYCENFFISTSPCSHCIGLISKKQDKYGKLTAESTIHWELVSWLHCGESDVCFILIYEQGNDWPGAGLASAIYFPT